MAAPSRRERISGWSGRLAAGLHRLAAGPHRRLAAGLHRLRELAGAPEGRIPGLRTLRVVVATVAAYAVADLLPSDEKPVVAALTALLVVQLTVYQTVRSGWQRIVSVVAGVLVAVLLSGWVGLTWWSLGLTVLTALVVGYWLRLGPHTVEAPISAMLVLAVAGDTRVGLDRVYETLVGAGVGVLASLLASPVYMQPAGDAIGELATRMSRLLHSVAGDLEQGWKYERAAHGLDQARRLEEPVERAREAVARAEDSLRLNPRRRAAQHVPPTLRSGLTALEYAAINTRVICRSLADRVAGVPAEALPGPEIRQPLARLLAATADAVAAFGALVASDVAGPAGPDEQLLGALRRARSLRDTATLAMRVDAEREPDLWRVHGALLAHVDRLLTEIDPDAQLAGQAIHRPPPAAPTVAITALPEMSVSALRRQAKRARAAEARGRRRLTRDGGAALLGRIRRGRVWRW